VTGDYANVVRSIVPGTFAPDMGALDEKPVVSAIPGSDEDASGVTSFKDTLQHMLTNVNDKLATSDANSRDYATGATDDLGKVVTSMEEANLALQYTMAIRSKLLSAYTTISQLQM
jgi:flagellar hook-basal body complex protein FliE